MDAAARLVVEFDGSYWHSAAANPSAPKRDLRKTAEIRKQGWTVVRVRESPLSPVGAQDLIVPFACTGSDLSTRVADHVRTVLTARTTACEKVFVT